jgi:choline dehydrogenase
LDLSGLWRGQRRFHSGRNVTEPYDYVIVGAGTAGSVLANRLSLDPATRVLLLEAGPTDNHPFIRMPKGFAKVAFDPKLCWYFPIESELASGKPEVWLRGKTLGGSSSINGELYVRGLSSDFDAWAAEGLTGWGWSELLACFRDLENHVLGATDYRGGHGPLHVSVPSNGRQPAIRAFVEAAKQMGLPYAEDYNAPGGERVGLFPQTVHRGRRVSAATAFLAPARGRRNLEVLTGQFARSIEFNGRRARGIVCADTAGVLRSFQGREIILCAGALNTPKLLQLSGIGPPAVLQKAGIDVLHASPLVGANLREHRYLRFQYRLKTAISANPQLRGLGLALNVARYYLTHTGPLASGAFDVGAMVKSHPSVKVPDIQINMVPMSMDMRGSGFALEAEPGLQIITYPMRPTSEGAVSITSADPTAPLKIRANYLSSEYDRAVSVAMVPRVRELFAQPALRAIVQEETMPGAMLSSSDEIINTLVRAAGRGQGAGPGQHAACTCAMGRSPEAPLDTALRVNGVEGLRVMDASVLPTMVSGNTNAPILAMAWRAADIIRQTRA